jgi:hypothetical protein
MQIDSVFIFPTLEHDIKEIEYFADHIVDLDIENYFYIKCIKIDVNILIKNFIQRKTCHELIKVLVQKKS